MEERKRQQRRLCTTDYRGASEGTSYDSLGKQKGAREQCSRAPVVPIKTNSKFQKMIFATSCMLKASPGPRPGAPKKSPAVSVTLPKFALVSHGLPGVVGPHVLPTAPTP